MPKRSSGCYRCRQRKVKCDEAKPECQRCNDLGVRCNGYRGPGDVEFRDQTDHYTRAAHAGRGLSERTYSEPTPCSSSSKQTSRPTRSFSIPLTFPLEIDSYFERRTSLFNTFLQEYLPPDCGDQSISGLAFLALLPQIPDKGPTLTAAMSTIAAVGIGTVRMDNSLLSQSRKFYSDALQRVSMALNCPIPEEEAEQTLAAVQILSLCETFMATSSSQAGWVAHEEGARSIFESSTSFPGPSRLGQFLFYSNRFRLTYIGFGTRRAVVYDQFEWLQRTSPHAADAFVSLTDVLVQIPRILEQTDQVFSTQNSEAHRIELQTILRASSGLQQQLRQWLQIHTHNQTRKFHALFSLDQFPEFSALGLDYAFDGAWSFSSFRSALLLTSYWNGMGLLALNIMQLLSQRRTTQQLPFLLDDKTLKVEANECAVNICQSVPFFFTKSVCGLFGRRHAPWPLRFARQFYAFFGDQPQNQFCETVEMWLVANGICVPCNPPTDAWSPTLDVSPAFMENITI